MAIKGTPMRIRTDHTGKMDGRAVVDDGQFRRQVKARPRDRDEQRDKLAGDVEAFLSRGGHVETIVYDPHPPMVCPVRHTARDW